MAEVIAPVSHHDLPPLPPVVGEPPSPAGAWESFLAGARMARQRLLRRRVALLGLLAFALAVTSAIIERNVSSAGAVDRALEATFRLLIPLVTYAITAEVCSRSRLGDAAWPAARFGAKHRDVVLGLLAASVAASALAAAVLAAASVLVAHSSSAPPLLPDAALSAWIGAITAGAYAGWFALGSTFAKLGRGRFGVLLVDFVLGGGAGLAGALFPRANAGNLLGGTAPLGLSQQASTTLLALQAVVLCIVALMRVRP